MSNSAPLRVAFVAHVPGLGGGADRLLYELVVALAEAALCEVVVVVPGEGGLAVALREAGVPIAMADYGWWWCTRLPEDRPSASLAAKRALSCIARAWPAARSIARALEEFSPDVIASNTCVIPAGAVAAMSMRTPHVWLAQEHGRNDYDLTFFLGFGNSMRFLSATSAAIVVITRALARELERYVAPHKIHVLHAASITPPGLPVVAREEGEPLRLILLGSGVPGKGVDDAIRAVALARSQGVDVQLRLVGVHHPEPYRQLSMRLGVGDEVEVLGRVDDPVAEIDRAHVGLMCSRSEAFGRVTVEYLRRGRPVIGTRAGGTPELIEDGVTGLLYDSGDIEALAERIETFASSDEILVGFSVAAIAATAARFVLDDYVQDFCDLLQHARVTRTTQAPKTS